MVFPPMNCGQEISHQYPLYAPLAAKLPSLSLTNNMTSYQVAQFQGTTLDLQSVRRPLSCMTLTLEGSTSPATSISLKGHLTQSESQLKSLVSNPCHMLLRKGGMMAMMLKSAMKILRARWKVMRKRRKLMRDLWNCSGLDMNIESQCETMTIGIL